MLEVDRLRLSLPARSDSDFWQMDRGSRMEAFGNVKVRYLTVDIYPHSRFTSSAPCKCVLIVPCIFRAVIPFQIACLLAAHLVVVRIQCASNQYYAIWGAHSNSDID